MRGSQRTRHWLVVRDTDRHGGRDPSDGGMQREVFMRGSQRTRHWLVVRDTDRHGGSDPSDGGMQRRQSCIEFGISPEATAMFSAIITVTVTYLRLCFNCLLSTSRENCLSGNRPD